MRMAIGSAPQLLSFITCDGIHLDPSTRKYTLLGLFSGIQAVQFPMVHPRMFVFVTLGEIAAGDHVATLSLALPGQDSIFEQKQAFKSSGPLQRIHLVSQLQNLQFTQDGDYGFMIEINDEPLMVINFPVRRIQLPPGVSGL